MGNNQRHVPYFESLRVMLRGKCDCTIAREKLLLKEMIDRQNPKPVKRKFDLESEVPANSYLAAVLADMAYKSQSELESELLKYGYFLPRLWLFRTPLASAFITEWDDAIVVAFKGSSNAREWINNLNIWLAWTPYGRIHAGFYRSIKKIGPSILEVIYPGLLSGSKVIITGHSRGGALATLFAFLLALNGFSAAGVYSFGSPKVGDGEFANNWRKEDEKYPVRASLVPQWLIFPLAALMNLAYVLWVIGLLPLFFKARSLFRRMLGRRQDAQGQESYTPLKDHLMSSYLRSITEDVKWRTDVCFVYHGIIGDALSTMDRRGLSWGVIRNEYASLVNVREELVASPVAIERFCQRHGLLMDPVIQWISDYRAFLETREIRREDEFKAAFSALMTRISKRTQHSSAKA